MKPSCAALLAAVLLDASTAAAFTRSKVPSTEICTFWKERELRFVQNEKGSKDIADDSELVAVRNSFKAWSDTACSDLTFKEDPVTARTDVGFDQDATDNTNLIIFRNRSCTTAAPSGDPCFREGGCQNKFDCFDQTADTIGVTTTTFSNRTGQIFDADMELNADGYLFTTVDAPPCAKNVKPLPQTCVATDVANTVTHEAGHFLGLDHPEVPEATMYRSAETGETKKRTLERDDLDGVCTIYPSGAPATTCVAEPDKEPAERACGCGSAAGAGWPAALLALLLARRRVPFPNRKP